MSATIIPSSFPIGIPFGRLTTTTLPYRKQRNWGLDWHVTCRCSCGNTKEYLLSSLRCGDTCSCGCLKSVTAEDIRLRSIWRSMKSRCYNPKHERFYRYGGRGIKICDPWLNSFAVFREWAVNHPAYREGLTIERVDGDKGYIPENCTWIPKAEQAFNRSTTRYFEYQGERKLLSQWLKDPRCLASSLFSLQQRIRKGWDFDTALTTPAQGTGPGRTKVTEDQVREIRAEYAAGGISQREIGEKHGIGQVEVSHIVTRRAWSHVE
jgi:hypothetical protein